MNRALWMIRHSDCTFTRPISKEKLVEKIESGEVLAGDEVCSGDGYWFSIQEVEEVKKFFGNIRLQALMPTGLDVTSAANPLALPQTRRIEAGNESQAKPISQLAQTQFSVEKHEEETPPTLRGLFFGVLLSLIFFGILIFLWMGSH